jgi:DNA-directed RNA polymerase subunit E'/Rpb7
MDNKIYINLKNNLQKLTGKCFSKYGYIVKIIEILDYKDGIIEAENTESSALFDLDFSCRICAPLRNTQIICEVERVNKLLITARNGPILVIITNDRTNTNIFFKDNNNNIRYKKDGKSDILQPHDFIKVTLVTIHFNDGDENIKVIGFLDDIASEEEKKFYYKDLYTEEGELIEYEKYVRKDKVESQEEEINDIKL